MTNDDDTMDFFRIVNKEFTQAEEIQMVVRTALEMAFGEDEAKRYRGDDDA